MSLSTNILPRRTTVPPIRWSRSIAATISSTTDLPRMSPHTLISGIRVGTNCLPLATSEPRTATAIAASTRTSAISVDNPQSPTRTAKGATRSTLPTITEGRTAASSLHSRWSSHRSLRLCRRCTRARTRPPLSCRKASPVTLAASTICVPIHTSRRWI